MKNLLILFVLTISLSSYSQQDIAITWHTNLEDAQEVAKEENKPLLLYFTGSDWCKPCLLLKEDFFESEEFVALADQFVMVYLDLPFRDDIISEEEKAMNKKIAAKYNPSKSYPLIVAFNSRGREIDRIASYSTIMRDTRYHFEFVNKILNQS